MTTWPGPGATSGEIRGNQGKSGEIRGNQEILYLSSGGKESTMLRGKWGNTWLSWLPATTPSSLMVTQLGEDVGTSPSFCLHNQIFIEQLGSTLRCNLKLKEKNSKMDARNAVLNTYRANLPQLFNRPSIAGAVLQTPLSLIMRVIHFLQFFKTP